VFHVLEYLQCTQWVILRWGPCLHKFMYILCTPYVQSLGTVYSMFRASVFWLSPAHEVRWGIFLWKCHISAQFQILEHFTLRKPQARIILGILSKTIPVNPSLLSLLSWRNVHFLVLSSKFSCPSSVQRELKSSVEDLRFPAQDPDLTSESKASFYVQF
jgi:hypothetical protein